MRGWFCLWNSTLCPFLSDISSQHTLTTVVWTPPVSGECGEWPYVSKLQIPAMRFKLSCRNCPILTFQRVTYENHTLKSTYINVLKLGPLMVWSNYLTNHLLQRILFFLGLLRVERGWFRIHYDNSPFCHLVIRHHSLPDASKHESSAHPCRSDFKFLSLCYIHLHVKTLGFQPYRSFLSHK